MFSGIGSHFSDDEFLAAVRNGKIESIKMLLEKNRLSCRKVITPYDTGSYKFKDTQVDIIGVYDSIISFEAWFDAIRETAKKGHCEMFMTLLDCDLFVVPSTEIFKDILLRKPSIIHNLMTSGKFSVNAINIDSATVLHLVCSECQRNPPNSWFCSRNHRNKEIHRPTEILLKNNANVNAKNSFGETALINASASGCTSIVYTILKWAKETNSFIDINARDMIQHTALMKASIGMHPDVVRLLINAGASVNLSDSKSCTALHFALVKQGNPLEFVTYGECRGDIGELNVRRNTNALLINIERPHQNYGREKEQLEGDRYATVKLLLESKDVDVNVLMCYGHSPMDMCILAHEESLIAKLLRQKEAKPSAFQNTTRQRERNDLSIRGHNMLHRLVVYMQNKQDLDAMVRSSANEVGYISSKILSDFKENFRKLSKNIQTSLVSAKDFRGRTALHLAVMGGYYPQNDTLPDDVLAATLISFGCKVNETDNYGRTPLHYARNLKILDLLLAHEADPMKTDNKGITAIDMFEKRVNGEYVWSLLDENMLQELCPMKCSRKWTLRGPIQSLHFHGKSPTKPIYKEDKFKQNYDMRQLTANKISEEIKNFMSDLAIEIKRQDPRFEISVKPVGSSYEGTKISKPDEFDFMLILTKFSELCEAHQSPELPTGYVQLKRKRKRSGERNESEFYPYFDVETGVANVAKLHEDFNLVLSNALRNSEFVKHQNSFDWEYDIPLDITKSHKMNIFKVPTLYLRKTDPIVTNDVFLENISIDLVPCIHLKAWSPNEVLASLRSDIEARGCYLVIDNPQRKCPWIQYSEFCAKISFAPYDCEIIRQSSEKAKTAFLIAKDMINYLGEFFKKETSYVLKTCLLYCIEAFNPTVEKASGLGLSFDELKSQFDQLSIQFWLQNLMKCVLRFMLLDFCPCYFMPSFQMLSSKRHVFFSIHACIDDMIDCYQCVYNLYRSVSQHGDCICFRIPDISFLNENFDRNELMAELSTAAMKEVEKEVIKDADALHYDYLYSRDHGGARQCDCAYAMKQKFVYQ